MCGVQTWQALVEAGHRLGDRLLYLAEPMARGDDVAELQERLAALGFDPGKTDGIFGVRTADALAEFQRNAGLRRDAVCGPVTIGALRRLGGRDRSTPVTSLHERELLRRGPRTLADRRVVVAERGGLGALVATLARELLASGADAVVVDHPDESAQAEQANRLDAAVLVALTADPDRDRPACAYYARAGYESAAGRRLATLTGVAVAGALGVAPDGPIGMRLPVLRETRMPAVVVHLAPVALVVERTPMVATALAGALAAWAGDPCDT